MRAVRTAGGMIGSGHPLATAEGLAVLRDGGNAVDAAIAAATVLSVVCPHECALGGDLLALFYNAADGSTHALNASGQAPAAAVRENFGQAMPQLGPRSVSVPGMVGGWADALQRFGTRELGSLMQGAIRHAEEGYPVHEDLCENAGKRTESLFADPNSKAMFFPDGQPIAPGTLLRQPALAKTLRTIANEGAQAFYQGPIAESMCRALQSREGLLAPSDLKAYRPLWQQTLDEHIAGHTICTMPPSSWAAAMLLQLMMIEREGVAQGDAQFMLQGVRTRRDAYALLEGCIADPAAVPGKARAVLDAWRASGVTASRPAGPEGMHGIDTSNVVVMDRQGNAVSLLQSVFVPFGSGVLDPHTGVLFNNRMRGFSVREGDPNCVGPGKRPAQTLTPVLVLGKQGVALACNTPGGPGQTGTMAQFLARVLLRGESMPTAIAAPRWSKTLVGDFIIEGSADASVKQAVLAAEPEIKVQPWGAINFGSIVAIGRDGDALAGCADTRRHACVAGL